MYSLDEVFRDPQVRHLNITRKVNHAADGEVEILRHAVTFSDAATRVASAAPIAGAHTVGVLAELGLDDDEIRRLLDSGAVATRRHGGGFGSAG